MPSGSTPPQRARLVDVANQAGVTKSVASRVLNGDATINVRDSTRTRILEAAADLDYAPHAGAKALAVSRSRAIALLIPDLMNSVYARIARGAYQRAREHGYVVMIAEDTENSDAKSLADLVTSGRVEGLLIASIRANHPFLEGGQLAQIPHVFVNRSVPGSGRNATVDMCGAGRMAFRYLSAQGHRHLAHISGPGELTPALERERGFAEAAHDTNAQPPVIVSRPFSETGGYEAAVGIMKRHPDTTAIFVGTFSQSIGALKALADMGFRVPQDVSVLSYDDLPMAEFLIPALSAMSIPLLELGQVAVDLLVDQLNGEPARDLAVTDTIDVLERGSTAPPTR